MFERRGLGLVLSPAAVGSLLAGHGGHGAEEGFAPDDGGGLESVHVPRRGREPRCPAARVGAVWCSERRLRLGWRAELVLVALLHVGGAGGDVGVGGVVEPPRGVLPWLGLSLPQPAEHLLSD